MQLGVSHISAFWSEPHPPQNPRALRRKPRTLRRKETTTPEAEDSRRVTNKLVYDGSFGIERLPHSFPHQVDRGLVQQSATNSFKRK